MISGTDFGSTLVPFFKFFCIFSRSFFNDFGIDLVYDFEPKRFPKQPSKSRAPQPPEWILNPPQIEVLGRPDREDSETPLGATGTPTGLRKGTWDRHQGTDPTPRASKMARVTYPKQ